MTPQPATNPALWYCVRTQTKREHVAAELLRELDAVEVFCPRLRYRKATRRGKVWWTEPMFPGYLMARFDLATRERAVTFCQGVRGLVRFGGKVPDIAADFVESLRSQVHTHSGDDTETVCVSPRIDHGDEVEMSTGPLRGLRGTVVEVASAVERVKVLFEFLGRSQIISVDLFSILLPKRPLAPIAPDVVLAPP
ncbi:MAG: transcription termination/antitermination NusG family protein [Verrucomicrobiota bacterium]